MLVVVEVVTDDVVTDDPVVLVVGMQELHNTGHACCIALMVQSPTEADEHGLTGSTKPLQTPVVVLLLLVVVDELVVLVVLVIVVLVIVELVETVLVVNVDSVLEVLVVELAVVDDVVTQLLHSTGHVAWCDAR